MDGDDPAGKPYGAALRALVTPSSQGHADREACRVQIDGPGKIRFRVTETLIGRLCSVTLRFLQPASTPSYSARD